MRKTRLVILPGVRSLRTIGCLLLFLACPNIAFEGGENREVVTLCKAINPKELWLLRLREPNDRIEASHSQDAITDNEHWLDWKQNGINKNEVNTLGEGRCNSPVGTSLQEKIVDVNDQQSRRSTSVKTYRVKGERRTLSNGRIERSRVQIRKSPLDTDRRNDGSRQFQRETRSLSRDRRERFSRIARSEDRIDRRIDHFRLDRMNGDRRMDETHRRVAQRHNDRLERTTRTINERRSDRFDGFKENRRVNRERVERNDRVDARLDSRKVLGTFARRERLIRDNLRISSLERNQDSARYRRETVGKTSPHSFRFSGERKPEFQRFIGQNRRMSNSRSTERTVSRVDQMRRVLESREPTFDVLRTEKRSRTEFRREAVTGVRRFARDATHRVQQSHERRSLTPDQVRLQRNSEQRVLKSRSYVNSELNSRVELTNAKTAPIREQNDRFTRRVENGVNGRLVDSRNDRYARQSRQNRLAVLGRMMPREERINSDKRESVRVLSEMRYSRNSPETIRASSIRRERIDNHRRSHPNDDMRRQFRNEITTSRHILEDSQRKIIGENRRDKRETRRYAFGKVDDLRKGNEGRIERNELLERRRVQNRFSSVTKRDEPVKYRQIRDNNNRNFGKLAIGSFTYEGEESSVTGGLGKIGETLFIGGIAIYYALFSNVNRKPIY